MQLASQKRQRRTGDALPRQAQRVVEESRDPSRRRKASAVDGSQTCQIHYSFADRVVVSKDSEGAKWSCTQNSGVNYLKWQRGSASSRLALPFWRSRSRLPPSSFILHRDHTPLPAALVGRGYTRQMGAGETIRLPSSVNTTSPAATEEMPTKRQLMTLNSGSRKLR